MPALLLLRKIARIYVLKFIKCYKIRLIIFIRIFSVVSEKDLLFASQSSKTLLTCKFAVSREIHYHL